MQHHSQKGYATPRIRLTFPASVNWIGRNFCLVGQLNNTSPPPSGATPLLLICT